MILIPFTFEPYDLKSILITNVSTGTNNYNAQTLFFMRMCQIYVNNLRYNLEALK